MGKQFVGRNSIQVLLVLAASLACGCGGTDTEGTHRGGQPGINTPGATGGTADTGGSVGSAGTGGKPSNTGGKPGTGGMATTVGTGGMMPGDPPMAKTFYAGNDPKRNTVIAGAICIRLAQIQCAGEAFCCDDPGRDPKACEAAQLDVCAKEGFLDAISMNPIAGFDATRAAAAFEKFEMLASKCDPAIASFGASADGLRGILQGTVPPGGKCDQPALNTVPYVAAAALASCSSGATNSCLPKSPLSGWTCAARAAAGGDCLTDLNCADGIYCPNPRLKMLGLGKCAMRKADGMPCAAGNECTSLACKGGACVKADAQTAYCLAK